MDRSETIAALVAMGIDPDSARELRLCDANLRAADLRGAKRTQVVTRERRMGERTPLFQRLTLERWLSALGVGAELPADDYARLELLRWLEQWEINPDIALSLREFAFGTQPNDPRQLMAGECAAETASASACDLGYAWLVTIWWDGPDRIFSFLAPVGHRNLPLLLVQSELDEHVAAVFPQMV